MQKTQSTHCRGSAIIIAISLIVVLSGLVIVLLNRTLNQGSAIQANEQLSKRSMIGDWAETAITSDLIEEMAAGSELIAVPNSDVDFIMQPNGDRHIQPQASLTKSQVNGRYLRDFKYKNLLKQSKSEIPSFQFTGMKTQSHASDVSSEPWLNSHEWNAPFLIPKEYADSLDTPDWVYLDEYGDYVQQHGSPRNAVGRYAYRVYDLGSLVNLNVSGYPTQADEWDYSSKSSPVWIDLKQLPGFKSSFVDDLTSWKLPTVQNLWGKEHDELAISPARQELEFGWLNDTSGLEPMKGGNVFTSRQDMINYFRDNKQSPDSLNFVTHYSYSHAGVNYFPDTRLPNVEFEWAQGGNDAYHDRGKSLTERINTAPALHRNEEGALMSQKFPLEKMALVSEAVPGEEFPVDKAAEVRRLFGLEWDDIENHWEYVDEEILTFAEYSEVSTPKPVGHEGYWGPNFFQVLKAAIHVGSLGRQMNNQGSLPNVNFSNGALHYGFPNFSGRPSPAHTSLLEDGILDHHTLKLGVNIIDQWDKDSFPTRVMHDGVNGFVYHSGIEDLPMLYGSITQSYGLGYLPTRFGPSTGQNPTNYQHPLWNSWFLQPILWNMHAPKKIDAQQNVDTFPMALRVLANTSPIQIKVASKQFTSNTQTDWLEEHVETHGGSLPEDYSTLDPYYGDLTGLYQAGDYYNNANFADLSVRYSNQPSDSDAFAFLSFTVNPSHLSNGSFRDPQVIRSDLYPEGVNIYSSPDRADIPYDLAASPGYPFSLLQADTKMTVKGANLADSAVTVANEFYPAGHDRAGYYTDSFNYHGGRPAMYSPVEEAWVDQTRWMREGKNGTRGSSVENSYYDRNGQRGNIPAEMRQSVVGFRLATLPIRMNPFDYSKGALIKIDCDSSSLHLEYQRNGKWIEYDVMQGAITDDMLMVQDIERSLNLRADPRTNRWGTFATNMFAVPFTWDSPHNMNNWVGGFSPFGRHFEMNTDSFGPNVPNFDETLPYFHPAMWKPEISGVGNTTHWVFGKTYDWNWPIYEEKERRLSLEALQWNDANNNLEFNNIAYKDPDGIQRRATSGDLLETHDPFRVGQPLFDRDPQDPAQYKDDATMRNYRSRPIILDRDFNSVAEMGYAFRDVAFKNIDFMMPESGDKALLDFFSVREAKNSTYSGEPLKAGLVDLNTPHLEILTAILSGTRKVEDVDNIQASGTDAHLIARQDADKIARLVYEQGQDQAFGGFDNFADLISKYDGSGLQYADFQSMSPSLAQNFGEIDGRIKRRFESVVRALTSNTSTGTWNVLIDVVAQTGRLKSDKRLDGFVASGQERKWVCLTIDRFTGKVLHRSEEIVF